MSWFLSPALVTLRKEVDAVYPSRSTVSDGTVGDPAHAARTSDHNPAADGEVCAWDCTYDKDTGLGVAPEVAEFLRSTKDPRIKYVIWNKRIFRSYPKPGIPAWSWAPYTGTNTHEHHCHISVDQDASGARWGFHSPVPAAPAWTAPRYPMIDGPFHEGDKNPGAQQAKVLLKEAGFAVPGSPLWTWTQTFGKGAVAATRNAQVAYWRNKGLSAVDAAKKASGVLGPVTWDWLCDVIKVLKAQGLSLIHI